MIDVMIDIETTATTQQAGIIAIAALEFDPERATFGESFCVAIDRESWKNMDFDVSRTTLNWWDKNQKALEQINELPQFYLSDALSGLNIFISKKRRKHIWANSPRFDLAILEHAYKQLGQSHPWKYWDERCVRTVNAILPGIAKKVIRTNAHHPLDDCKYQAKCVSAVLKQMLYV